MLVISKVVADFVDYCRVVSFNCSIQLQAKCGGLAGCRKFAWQATPLSSAYPQT